MSLVKDFVLYNPLELLLSGSASPTRGKSLTCREDSPNLAVYDRGSETPEKKGQLRQVGDLPRIRVAKPLSRTPKSPTNFSFVEHQRLTNDPIEITTTTN